MSKRHSFVTMFITGVCYIRIRSEKTKQRLISMELLFTNGPLLLLFIIVLSFLLFIAISLIERYTPIPKGRGVKFDYFLSKYRGAKEKGTFIITYNARNYITRVLGNTGMVIGGMIGFIVGFVAGNIINLLFMIGVLIGLFLIFYLIHYLIGKYIEEYIEEWDEYIENCIPKGQGVEFDYFLFSSKLDFFISKFEQAETDGTVIIKFNAVIYVFWIQLTIGVVIGVVIGLIVGFVAGVCVLFIF